MFVCCVICWPQDSPSNLNWDPFSFLLNLSSLYLTLLILFLRDAFFSVMIKLLHLKCENNAMTIDWLILFLNMWNSFRLLAARSKRWITSSLSSRLDCSYSMVFIQKVNFVKLWWGLNWICNNCLILHIVKIVLPHLERLVIFAGKILIFHESNLQNS